MLRSKSITLWFLIIMVLIALAGTSLGGTPVQLTNNTVDDDGAVVSGNNVVWHRSDGGYSLLRYDGSSITTITTSTGRISGIETSGENIVWGQEIGGDTEIMFFNGSTVTTITSNSRDDSQLDIDGDNYVWQRHDGTDYDIVFKRGTSTYVLSNNDVPDSGPKVSGIDVVWRSGDTTNSIMHSRNGVTTTVTTGLFLGYPDVSGQNVVWSSNTSGNWEIYLWDGATTSNISNGILNDTAAQVSGDNVVWVRNDGNDDEIMLFDGAEVTTVTDNQFDDGANGYLKVDGDNIVWQGSSPGDNEIFFYDGSTVTTLTDNDYDDYDPRISGNRVVWGHEDDSDYEVFTYVYDTTLPTDPTLSSSSHATGSWSNDNTVDLDIHPDATDTGSGVGGFAVNWSNGGTATPDQVVDIVSSGDTTKSTTSPGLFNGEWYANVSTVDNSGNWTATAHMGPFKIDTLPPSDPTIFSDSHNVDQWKSDNTIDLGIAPDAQDNSIVSLRGPKIQRFAPPASGIAGYSITFSKDTTEVPPQTICTSDTPNTTDTYTSPALDNGEWYANLSTADKAGNWTSTAHKGPFKIDRTKPTASVKINNGATYTKSKNVTLNISASDDLSGLWWMRVRNQGGEWSSWEDFDTTKEWELSAAAAATGSSDGTRAVDLEVKDRAYNHSAIVSDDIQLDSQKPVVRMVTPFVSTRISKTTTFKVKWWATDAPPSSGISYYKVKYRRSGSSIWRTWKSNTTAKEAFFKGKAGRSYYFRTYAYDNAGNRGYSKVYKTILPFNEGNSLLRRIGFNGYKKLGKSQNYLTSVRYSYRRGHTLVYKLYNNNAIGLVVTKGPKMGRAKIYVDGKYVRTVDAKSSKTRPRQLIFYKSFKKKGTHFLKVVNLGTPGRARFEVDAVVVGR